MTWYECILAGVVFLGSGGFSLGYVFIKNDARVRMAHVQGNSSASQKDVEALRAEVADLRQQLQQLRDTSLEYDLSFDTALRRLEQRMDTEVQQQIGR